MTMTKREKMEAILKILTDANADAIYTDFMQDQIDRDAAKAEKARAKAAEKKAEGDVMRDKIFDILSASGEFMTIGALVDALTEAGFEGVTNQKVVARLKQLKDADKVTQDNINVAPEGEKVKRVSAYKVA